MENFIQNILTGVRLWINGKFSEITLAEPVPNEIIKMLWDEDIEMSDIQPTTGSSDIDVIDTDTNREHYLNIFEMVDLGLSVKWARSNFGATCGGTAETWYGNYYAWGELEQKEYFDWLDPDMQTINYKHANGGENKLTKYCNNSNYGNDGFVDGLLQLELDDDVVNINYKKGFRMPTESEVNELLNPTKITNTWVNNYKGILGLNGVLFTSKVEGYVGNSIFIPASGVKTGSSSGSVGTNMYLWTANNHSGYPYYGKFLNGGKNSTPAISYYNRCIGIPVRAVCR